MTIETLYRSITSNKLFFSGMAILGIMLSHLIGADRDTLYWAIFYPGFSGVDIFLFFSGYGLCRSYEKNTITTFYQRRIKRVYPMLVVFTVFLYVFLLLWKREAFTALDVLCNLTTLNFWNAGGFLVEWYLSYILYLYLLFPLLYKAVRRWEIRAIATTFIAMFAFLFFYRDGWLYQCAASRIPVFLLGIYCYQQNRSEAYKKGTIMFLLMFVVMAGLFWGNIVQKFELVYMAAPLILLALAFVFQRAIKSEGVFFRMMTFLGKYSLEIYLSNMLILSMMPLLHFPWPVVLTYVMMHVILVPVMIYSNRFIQALL